jgi:hypothetical protein
MFICGSKVDTPRRHTSNPYTLERICPSLCPFSPHLDPNSTLRPQTRHPNETIVIRLNVSLLACTPNFQLHPSPNKSNTKVQLTGRKIHAKTAPAPTAKSKPVLLQVGIIQPALRSKRHGLGVDLWIGVEQIGGFHDRCTTRDRVWAVGQIFVRRDARLARGNAMCDPEAFRYHSRLPNVRDNDLFYTTPDVLTRYGRSSSWGSDTFASLVGRTPFSSSSNLFPISFSLSK